MQLDIDLLSEMFDEKLGVLDALETNIDNLEKESRKSTMRVFGIAEDADEAGEKAQEIVTEKVLKPAYPEQDWEPDDIQRAYRVGTSNEDQPRMMLVTFRYSDDKFRIKAGRAVLRERGIRVSDDLTLRQRKQLQSLKAQGKTGYFHKGELKVRPEKSSFASSSRQRGEPDSKRLRLENSNGPHEPMDFDNHGAHSRNISAINDTLALLAEDSTSSQVELDTNSKLNFIASRSRRS